MTYPPLPAHLAAALTVNRNSRRALELREDLWLHFEPFLAQSGYEIAWNGNSTRPPELRLAVNPFVPRPGEAFTAATAGRDGVRWGGPRAFPFLMGAYDRYRRFVVIKIVSSGGGELSILQRFTTSSARRDLQNHTIPVVEYLAAGEWTFVVMPSWELPLRDCIPMSTAADFLAIGVQCLQGLTYMHRQRIAHLDVYPSNILANHVVHRPTTPFIRLFNFRLAYIDFEFSTYVSGGTPLIDVKRLPPTYHDLPEVKARRRHVDPFAADIFALGRTLEGHIRCQIDHERDYRGAVPASRDLFQRASRYLSLTEQMTAEDPANRPTAAQALNEAQAILASL